MLHIAIRSTNSVRPGVWWPAGASFALDFTRGKAMLAQASIGFSGAVSVARSTSKYALGSNGLYFPFSPGTAALTGAGLSIEPAATNLCVDSQDLTQASWFRSAVSLSGGIDDPAGGNQAMRIIETSSAAQLSKSMTVSAGASYTLSRIVRRGNFDWLRFTVGDPVFSNAAYGWFNLAAGTLGNASTVGGGYAFSSRRLTPIGNGYSLVSVTLTVPSAPLNFSLTSAAGNGSTVRADVGSGAGVNGFYDHWNTQFEAGAGTSPILAGAAPTSRGADTLSLPLLPNSGTMTLTFDDAGTQTIMLPSALPTAFNRSVITGLVVMP